MHVNKGTGHFRVGRKEYREVAGGDTGKVAPLQAWEDHWGWAESLDAILQERDATKVSQTESFQEENGVLESYSDSGTGCGLVWE